VGGKTKKTGLADRVRKPPPRRGTGEKLIFPGGVGGSQPSDRIRIDRLCRLGGEFAALPQTEPELKKAAKPTF
jgi:hypothetical protein